ncbi:MAG: hypothetical protein R3E31_04310 [Chloroflexota bacterium]
MMKIHFLYGGVVSSVGKACNGCGIGPHFESTRIAVAVQKLDPISTLTPAHVPYQHGEVFVTEDGAETDLDLGHYERLIDISAVASFPM